MMTENKSEYGKGKDQPHYELPNAKTLEEAGELKIKDEYGKEIQFKNLYANKQGQQNLIIFIRHFFCGVRLSHCLAPDP